MTVLHAGGKFDKDSYKVSGGLHGVGISCVNALSQKVRAEIKREGKIFRQEYERGKPTTEVDAIGVSDQTGTIITFWPDPQIFETTEFKYDTLANRLRELSFLNSGLYLTLRDEREIDDNGLPRQETFFSEGGLKEFVTFLDESRTPLIDTPIYVKARARSRLMPSSPSCLRCAATAARPAAGTDRRRPPRRARPPARP